MEISETAKATELARTERVVAAPRRVPSWVLPLITSTVVAVDAALAGISFVAAFKTHIDAEVLASEKWDWSDKFAPYGGIVVFAVVVRVLMTAYQRLYRFEGAFSYSQETIRLFKSAAVGSLLIVAWAFLFRGGFAFREFSYSRALFIIDFAFAFLLLTTFHLALRYVQTGFRKRGINLLPTLVVGTNSEAEQTITELKRRPDLGYKVVGVVSVDNGEVSGDLGSPIVGGFDLLPSLIRDLAINEVIVTDRSLESDRLFEAMMAIGRERSVEFRFAPSLIDVLPQKTSVEQIGILPMVRLFREPLSDSQRFLKRFSDIVLAVMAGVLTLPIWLISAIMVRLDSRGPVLFRQERVGMDGRIFLCYKFRTMYADADDRLHREAYQKNIAGETDANTGDEAEPVFGKVKDDPRITRSGRWIRRASIDELPQLINVLIGDMSIVGPRPPIPYEVENYDTLHRKRLDVKPGLTGLWQVSGRNRLSFDEMVRIDLYYIENWSLLLDLKVILLTIPAIFRGDGAR